MRAVMERPAPASAVGSQFTPEHLQLLSDAQLRAVADGRGDAWRRGSAQFRRLALRELRRRHGRGGGHHA